MAYSDGDSLADQPCDEKIAAEVSANNTNGDVNIDKESENQRSTVQGHPLLKTWSPPRQHNLSSAQMESLTAICDTLVPSLESPFKAGEEFETTKGATVDDVNKFYALKPSDEGVIDVVAGLMQSAVRPEGVKKILDVLDYLSTALGTFILALLSGVITLSPRYPFCKRFALLSRDQREKILQGWAHSYLRDLRLMFRGLKSLTCWAFYSKLGVDGRNACWKAIGYCGPAPAVTNRGNSSPPEIERPLRDKHIDVKEVGDSLKKLLADAGCTILENINDLREQAGSLEAGNDFGVETDVVVVGSGSGGGVAAAVLAKAGYKVLVLEKGQYFAAQDFTSIEGPSLINLFEQHGALATEDGGVSLYAGTSVGGGTTINWSVCFKTPENVRNEWVNDYGLDLFGGDEYEQAMQAVWERLSVQPEVNKHSPQNLILREGSRKLGYHHGTLQRNCPADHYCGWCSFGCPTGQKQSTSETWLVDAINTNNALVLSNCKVEKVLHGVDLRSKKGRRAQGVVATVGNGRDRMYIKARATVVSCGALMTPVLLLNSGLKNPNIGKYLRLHPTCSNWGYFPEGTGPEGRCYEGGIMTFYSPVAARKPTDYGSILETPSLHPTAVAAFSPWNSGADGKERMLRFARTSHITVISRDKGSGTVGIDKDGAPIFKYSLSKYDQDSLVSGAVQSLRVLIAAGAVEVGTHQFDGERFKAQGAFTAEIEAYLRRVQHRGVREHSCQIVSAHQLGSCRMGTNPKTSAIDARGEAWEVEGLFLGDGSVLPTSSGVNPMVTIQSIAYCTADSVVRFLKQQG